MIDWKEEIRQRLAGLNLEPTREAEIVEELTHHLQDRYEELMACSATEEEASRAALVELNDSQLLARELSRVERKIKSKPIVLGARRMNMVGDLWQDLRYALRTLLKSPGFTIVAVLTLALGIGANSAIFSVVNAILLRSLPYKQPDQLVTIHSSFPHLSGQPLDLSIPEFLDLREQAKLIEQIAVSAPISGNLTGVDQPERIEARGVSATFFSLLGNEPLLGRIFQPQDDQLGITEVGVVSYNLWQRRFGGDLNVIGRTLRMDDDLYTVVGVMPRGFRHPDAKTSPEAEFWYPAGFRAAPFPAPVRGDRRSNVIARLKPGVTLQQAHAELNSIASQLQREYPGDYPEDSGWRLTVEPLQEQLIGNIRPALLILFGAVGFVLLIACTNVANLLLARATGRQREMAIRAALGADRSRIIRQLLTESVLLSLVSGVFGLLLTLWSTNLLVSLSPENVPRLQEIRTDALVLGFTLLLSLFTGIVFGLAPAWQTSKIDLTTMLKEGSRGSGAGNSRLRSLLVIGEFALALVLLVGAGLLIRSSWSMQNVNPGFNSENVLTTQLNLPWPNQPEKGKYFRAPQRVAFIDQVSQRVEALPGVQAVGIVTSLPLSGDNLGRTFTIEGRDQRGPEDVIHAEVRSVSPDYFRAMEIPLQQGRTFTAQDDAQSPRVVIINEAMAQRYWPNEAPIGQRLKSSGAQSNAPWLTVIGIVRDIKTKGLDAETPPEMYLSYRQSTPLWMTLVARTASDPANLINVVNEQVRAVDSDLPPYRTRTMKEILSGTIAQKHFAMLLLGILAGIALILAAVGIYGVMAYMTRQRTREIGIRMALGAKPGDVLMLVMRQGLMLTLIGVSAGLAVAFAVTRVMGSLLYSVSATDPATFTAVALLLTMVALLACYLPARRATKVDPIVALRVD